MKQLKLLPGIKRILAAPPLKDMILREIIT
jgi:hypothetical protein